MTSTLDLGCGPFPKNPFQAEQVYGVDIFEDKNKSIMRADLFKEPIPFPDNSFDFLTAFDFIEHVPRVIYCPDLRFSFVKLMDEIYRVLKPKGKFLSFTPGYPWNGAFTDPTHVNFITLDTFPVYFGVNPLARMYGFKGSFEIERNDWHDWISPPKTVAPGVANPGNTHIFSILAKRP
jgi:SAM-dependent methyltransferase